MSQILRAFSATVDDVDNSDRSIVAKISVGTVDRYNSLILPRGINLKAYIKNPVVLFEHGKDVTRGNVPIGRNVWVKLNNQGNVLIAKTRFAKDSFSDVLFGFYSDGTMTGWSVRLLQQEQGGPPTREETRSYPGMDKCDIVYRSTELAEYSATSVPGNSDCLTDPELRSLFSEAQLESLSTLVVRGFWTPSEEVKPLIEPIIERMSESEGMASGGALVKDDDEDEGDEPDGDDDDAPKKKKKKKAKERSADDDAADSIEMAASEGCETRSADEVEAVESEPETEADFDDVTRDGPPDEPRNRIGEWTDGADGESDESKNKRRKSRPDAYDEDGRRKKKPTQQDVAKMEKLQAKFDKSPIYKTPDLKDEKTGEVFSFKVVKNAGYLEDPSEHKYYASTSGSKEGGIDNDGHNNPAKAAKAVDASYKRMKKDLDKQSSKSRSAPDDATIEVDDDELIGEWFDYLDETIVDRSAPEPEPVVEAVPAPEPEPAPVDPLAGLPPIVGRSLEDISRGTAVKVAAWEKSVKDMLGEFEGYLRGEA